ncbi:uncharacterized protein [Bos indicus]|uniref:Uncharacterized protein n=1 Tax=Bos indicus TaxID=9915 RepID=A0ABM4RR98_BOSIN
MLIGRWGFIHSPPTVRVHTHAPGARPPRGEWRGGGTGTAPPLVLAAWARFPRSLETPSPAGPTLHASRIPAGLPPGWPEAVAGMAGSGRRSGSEKPLSPALLPPQCRRRRAGIPAGLGGRELQAARVPGSVGHLARLASHGFQRARSSPLRASPARLGFPSSSSRPSSATPSTSAALREHPARAEAYRPDLTPLMDSSPGYRGPDEKLSLQGVK